ncbi:hypothetical protein GGR53DRAFT_203165 [Hypoxylon sp. FL1150]|nr:hypothetical protein GGR53DRAFT_203165 [Hypoxylon sp. FL1150]
MTFRMLQCVLSTVGTISRVAFGWNCQDRESDTNQISEFGGATGHVTPMSFHLGGIKLVDISSLYDLMRMAPDHRCVEICQAKIFRVQDEIWLLLFIRFFRTPGDVNYNIRRTSGLDGYSNHVRLTQEATDPTGRLGVLVIAWPSLVSKTLDLHGGLKLYVDRYPRVYSVSIPGSFIWTLSDTPPS